jgi:hypothetical protein
LAILAILAILEVAWWWLSPRRYRARPHIVTVLVAGFFLFMFLNGSVLFAGGAMRVLGAIAVITVATAWYAGRRA